MGMIEAGGHIQGDRIQNGLSQNNSFKTPKSSVLLLRLTQAIREMICS